MSQSLQKPARLKGFQDFLPEKMRVKQQMIATILDESRKAGFRQIDTPALEYTESLLGVGGETDKQVFRFLDNGGRDVALRFDLTVPFARFVTEHYGELVFPFKRVQVGPVWRAEKPQKGRYREFYQCDLDIIGGDALLADLEILLCFQNILHRLQLGAFTMDVGHRGVLSALLQALLGAESKAQEPQILILLDKLDKIGKAAVQNSLAELGYEPQRTQRLLELLAPEDREETDLEAVRGLIQGHAEALAQLTQLQTLQQMIRPLLGPAHTGKFRIRLGIVRGLGYYTGVVFETTLAAHPEYGSICSGGRYDHLADRFSKQPLPGVGASIGVDRLLAAIMEDEKEKAEAYAGFFVAVATEDAYPYGFQLLQTLRQKGAVAECSLKSGKIGQQFKWANRMGFRYVLTVGSEERTAQTVRLRDMQAGTESELSLAALWEKLPELI